MFKNFAKLAKHGNQSLNRLKEAIKPSQTLERTMDFQVYKHFSSLLGKDPGYSPMTGNEATAYIAYALSENSFIFPITPSSPMGEYMDLWKTYGKKNIWDKVVSVNMMQSEAGAAGAVHGSIAAGSLTSTFTCSQGLLLKIPNMFLIAGELMPCVFHVAARSITKHALSIHGDHMDVMHARSVGFAQLCSTNVQECMDGALIAHIATLKSRVPFIHFFDGFRTSHEINKIKAIDYADIAKVFPEQDLEKNLRSFALNPHNPIMRGTGQRPDCFFQATVASKPYFDNCPDIVEQAMKDVGAITGRHYKPFEYYGAENPENIIVSMGSSTKTIQETIDYLNKVEGTKYGVLNVRLFRPWSTKHFAQALPKSVKRIAVLDRTREEGSVGEPLYLDVMAAINELKHQISSGPRQNVELLTGGVYGLSSKEFTPAMVKAVYDNLISSQPKIHYCVGIEDDVSKSSIHVGPEFDPHEKDQEVTQCIFWGLGSDGTIGANQAAISTLAKNTKLKVQGYFAYDAYKTDGTTNSHLRFGKDEIRSPYMIKSGASYIACHKENYIYKYDMLKPLKQGGTFTYNSRWTSLELMEQNLPPQVKRSIAEKNAKFYTIDATKIAQEVGLGKRINNIMQACFYKLSGVLPVNDALALLKTDIVELYKDKGQKIVDMNQKSVDFALSNLVEIKYDREKWLKSQDEPAESQIQSPDALTNTFLNQIHKPLLTWEGNDIPVSAFEAGGYLRSSGTSQYEKRGIALKVPIWKPNECTQCNYCSFVCPHAVIRPFLLDREQQEKAPKDFDSRKAKGGSEMSGLNYSIQISTNDCTGCEVCVKSCPDNALVMVDFDEADKRTPHWDYAFSLPPRENVLDKMTVKGSQFEQPLLEFSGACGGCGETPYVKLLTQLFGDRMVIANATGCSMIWGSMFPSNPYTVKKDSHRGPAYGHSLFEDNAEYGYGMVLANQTRKQCLLQDMQELVPKLKGDPLKEKLKKVLESWIKNVNNWKASEKVFAQVNELLPQFPESEFKANRLLNQLRLNKNLLTVNSFWFVGGDGWAYDIGYGGLDHVLSTPGNFNVLVLDTEMYSNTGGQESKSTPTGASVKFDLGGKKGSKKDLGLQAITYGHVYVASIAMGASYTQAVQALREAEEYDGPSLILSLSPCIDWGFSNNNQTQEIQKYAVDCGYWPLYRFDPRRKEKRFQYDSKKIKMDVAEFLDKQLRFSKLKRDQPAVAAQLHQDLRNHINKKHDIYSRMSMDDFEMLEVLKKQMGETVTGEKTLVLYGSETGNALNLAQELGYQLKRRGIRANLVSMNDYDVSELGSEQNIYVLVSTAGQGEFPQDSKRFWKALSDPTLDSKLLENKKFAVFGLGDSSYVYFNEAAKLVEKRFKELGGAPLLEKGLGDDKDPERYETAWNEWVPSLYNEAGLKQPEDQLLPPQFKVNILSENVEDQRYVQKGYNLVDIKENRLLTPQGYDRDVRHYEFNTSQKQWKYNVGDVLAVQPQNNKQEVDQFLDKIGLNPAKSLAIEPSKDVKRVIPENITYGRLFTEVFDIFGRPNRNFYEFLGIYATDKSEKAALKHLITKEGKSDLLKLQKETVTCADLLQMYPSSIPSIDYMVEQFPLIKPRLYSIASSVEMTNNVQLCIILNDWKTPSGKYRMGLTTQYLKNLKPENNDSIACKIQEGPCPHPDLQTPAFLVALGTGMAPVRAFIQERAIAKRKGQKIGPTFLFYGNRHKATEFLYESELAEYQKEGVLTGCFTAFSRDQAHKIYVQNRIAENPEVAFDTLYKNKGYFYLCGQGGNVPDGVKKTLIDIFMKKANLSKEQADNYINQMRVEGRYNLDVW